MSKEKKKPNPLGVFNKLSLITNRDLGNLSTSFSNISTIMDKYSYSNFEEINVEKVRSLACKLGENLSKFSIDVAKIKENFGIPYLEKELEAKDGDAVLKSAIDNLWIDYARKLMDLAKEQLEKYKN